MGTHRFNKGGAFPAAAPAVNASDIPEYVLIPDEDRAPARRVSWLKAWMPLLIGTVVGAVMAVVLAQVILG